MMAMTTTATMTIPERWLKNAQRADICTMRTAHATVVVRHR